MTLVIHVTPNGTTGLELAGLPLRNGQFIESETPVSEREILVSIDLADAEDTDTAQEQYLNTNPNVVNYEVLP